MANNPVTFFEILGADPEKLKSFYHSAFGWQASPPSEIGYSVVDTGVAGTAAGGIGKAQQGPGWATFYVTVDDPAATLAEIERLGGSVVMPATEIPTGFTLGYFADPEGHIVGLVKR